MALEPSAREADPEIAALREEAGEVVGFDTRTAAERALVEPATALYLQGPAPDDPRPSTPTSWRRTSPDPAPRSARRRRRAGRSTPGPDRSAVSRTLFGACAYDPPPVVAYAARELGVDPAEIRVDVDGDPSAVAGDPDGDGGEWVPDLAFVVRRAGNPAYGAPVLARYVAEVEHGSASFERGQRAAMTRLAMRRRDLDVLVIRVDLEELPRSYDVSIRALEKGDGD